jgi:hypothetical protein
MTPNLEKLLKEATPGPRMAVVSESGVDVITIGRPLCIASCGTGQEALANARLIALAVNKLGEGIALLKDAANLLPNGGIKTRQGFTKNLIRAFLNRIEEEAGR